MLFLSFALGARINQIKLDKLKAESKLFEEAEAKKKLQAKLIESQKENIETLDAKVKKKTKAIRNILTHIPQGILTLDENLKVGDEYSDHLRDILHKKDIAGMTLSEMMDHYFHHNLDQASRTLTAIEFAMNQNRELNWDANAENLIREFSLHEEGGEKAIEVDWWPIENEEEDIVEVLVTLRDVTDLKKLKAKAESDQIEKDMLLEMLANDLSKTQKFLDRTTKQWQRTGEILSEFDSDPSRVYEAVFRVYHTIKGNARSLSFNRLAEAVHEAEEVLKELSRSYSADGLADLQGKDEAIRSLIQSYASLFDQKFQKLMPSASDLTGRLFEEFFEKNLTSVLRKIAEEVGNQNLLWKSTIPIDFLFYTMRLKGS